MESLLEPSQFIGCCEAQVPWQPRCRRPPSRRHICVALFRPAAPSAQARPFPIARAYAQLPARAPLCINALQVDEYIAAVVQPLLKANADIAIKASKADALQV